MGFSGLLRIPSEYDFPIGAESAEFIAIGDLVSWPKATMIQLIINPGMIDRRDRGLQRPWGSEGRHALLRNEPEQLRGRLSPYHARLGHQGGRDDEYSGLCRC